MSNLYAVKDEEVAFHFFNGMGTGKYSRYDANEKMREIMFKSGCYLADRTPPSLIRTFKKRMASFIIR